MTATDVQSAITELFTSVSDGKSAIAAAITDKGVETAADATFQQMADNIAQIQTGTDTSDATATAGDILSGKTAYGAAGKLTGTIPSQNATTITPGTSAKTAISAGTYAAGAATVAGDANLVAGNIKEGVSIFGVTGSFAGGGGEINVNYSPVTYSRAYTYTDNDAIIVASTVYKGSAGYAYFNLITGDYLGRNTIYGNDDSSDLAPLPIPSSGTLELTFDGLMPFASLNVGTKTVSATTIKVYRKA